MPSYKCMYGGGEAFFLVMWLVKLMISKICMVWPLEEMNERYSALLIIHDWHIHKIYFKVYTAPVFKSIQSFEIT